MQLLKEENYAEQMDGEVIPYLEKRKTGGTFERTAGQPIYYEHFTADLPKGTLVLVHGFSESVPKFYETIYYFLNLGWHVWAIQQREHGRSYRSTADPALICIEDHRDLIKDLHWFVKKIVFRSPENAGGSLPRVLFGHSMGGGVCACYLACYPDDFQKAILSSPMLELDSGAVPAFAAQFYAWFMIHTGKGRNYMPGAAPFRDVPDPESSCTSSEARYNYWFAIQRREPRYQMCVPAICTARQLLEITRFAGKAKNADRINARILLFQAGKDTMVKNTGQDKFVRLLGGKARLVRFPQAKHEIYFEKDSILNDYWKEIEEFL